MSALFRRPNGLTVQFGKLVIGWGIFETSPAMILCLVPHGPRLADSSFHFPPTAFLKKPVFRLFVVCTPICSNHPDTKIQKLSCESPYQTSRDTLLCQINCSVPLLFFFTCLCYIIHRRCHNFHGQS